MTKQKLMEVLNKQSEELTELRSKAAFFEQETSRLRFETQWFKRVIECLVSPDDKKRAF